MKLACIAFSTEGLQIAERISRGSGYETSIYDKADYKTQLPDIFKTYRHIVFVSSVGIAVRLSAPYLCHKACDPAIVVVDDLGRFSISLVSGHLGGANELAMKLSGVLDCLPVITTASDGRGIEAVDMFAAANGLQTESLEAAKKITAMMLEGRKIKLDSELALVMNYDNISETGYEAAVIVSSKESVSSDKPSCILRPRNINIGIGCRRGKSKDEILKAINAVLERNDISRKSIKTLATVDLKADEQGIIDACQELGCSLRIFDRESIAKVEKLFTQSEFVKAATGVSSVCEPCACLAGGHLIVNKTVINGITVAVARED
ncbi:MAG TPA: cobalt-precorrin 5A hydrolase [Negativicutes bacterium]|nr:cobalt-precorrin 5A hydrolase [Negativicutes bacterium]